MNICLISFDRPTFLRRALASLIAQNCPRWRCHLIDCSSTVPDVLDVISEYLTDDRITATYHYSNPPGDAAPKNDLLNRWHKAGLVVWVTDNTEYEPDFVGAVLDWFADNPTAHAGYVTHERDIFSPDGLTREGPASMSGHWDITPPIPGVIFTHDALGFLDHSQVVHRLPSLARWKTQEEAKRREVDGVYFDELIALHGPIHPIQPGRVLSREHLAWRVQNA